MLPTRSRVGKAAFGCVVAAITLVAIEGGLRLAWQMTAAEPTTHVRLRNSNDPNRQSLEVPRPLARSLAGTVAWSIQNNDLTSPDPQLLFRVRPNPAGTAVHCYTGIDQNGFRRTPGPDGQGLPILLLGDSCAFGWKLCDVQDTIGAQLEGQLRELGIPARVFNRAQPGYSSAQGLVMFHRWFPALRPQFVILYFGWNDRWIAEAVNDAEALRLMSFFTSSIGRGVTHLAIYRTVDWLIQTIRTVWGAAPPPRDEPIPGPPFRVPTDQTLANFAEIIDRSKQAGAQVIIIPNPHGNDPALSRSIDELNRAIGARFTGDAVILSLDAMRPENAQAHLFFESDAFHPNPAGARYIAEAIARTIRGQLPPAAIARTRVSR